MFKIAEKRELNPSMTMMKVVAPHIANKALPGQFIIFRVDEKGERVPLTIAGTDKNTGTVSIIFQKVGESTVALGEMNEGDYIADFVGPLGKPSELEGYNNVAVIGGGAGCAIAYPQAKYLHDKGASVDIIAGFRNTDLIILEEEMGAACTELTVMTDDGSNGSKGFVTNALKDKLDAGKKYDLVIAIGPLPMMKAVCNLTKEYAIKTIVSMNPIMIDGTGMCGGCRLTVGGETKFACVDGPDFDGHQVDFDGAMKRLGIYKDLEKDKLERHVCRLTGTTRDKETAAPTVKEQPENPLHNAPARNMSGSKNPMPEQDPKVRARNFEEVAKGYTFEMATDEAARCLNCKNPACVTGCPVNVRIPEFIAKLAVGDMDGAYGIIKSTNALPAVCGRVCPQEKQCESKCVRGIKGDPVGIGRLERFVADWHMANREDKPDKPASNGHKVAVIGSGPSGLTCAGDLANKGYEVTIFEALHMAGGVLMYGIPEFRLPKAIVQKEIDSLRQLGVDIKTDMVVGKAVSIDELFEQGYEAVFVGSGAGLPGFMHIEGENLLGVYSANEFLTRINLMKAYRDDYDTVIRKPVKAAIVGGGNVAMDAARCAMRLGAEEVSIIYRRGEAEMPARAEEVHHAKEEGIIFRLLSNPTRIIGDEQGRVTGIECIEMELGEPDASGRRRPVPKAGSEYVIDVDTVVMALGNTPNPLISMTTPGIETNRKGCLIVSEETSETTRENVYAGGDIVTGAATVILAMGAGKKAAAAIDGKIGGRGSGKSEQ